MKNTGKKPPDRVKLTAFHGPTSRRAALILGLAAGCVEPGSDEPGNDEPLSSASASLEQSSGFGVGSRTTYPVSESQNPWGLEGEIEAYGPMVAVADFNKDGNPDIAMENNYTAVMVRLGDGNGGFGAENRYNLGPVRPNMVIAKDLDGDGNLDLVTSNHMSVSVLRGNGNGTFGGATSYAISGCSWQPCHGSVTAADFNGDGTPDLVAGMGGGVGVFLGNGDATFGALTTYACGGTDHHNSVTAADFNGDGKLDLASAASWGTSVYVFPGNGNGTFGACTPTIVPSRPQSMTVGDFNKDGRPDLATANSWGISVAVLLNQGSGTFAIQNYPVSGREFDMLFVGAAYVDGDDSLDLLVSHQASVFVMKGAPDGTFTTTANLPMGSASRFVVTGHFDHDPAARTDLLVSSDLGNVVLLRGETDGAPCTSGCTPWIVGSTQATSGSAANGANGGLAIAGPGALRDGDVLYAFVAKNDDVGAVSAPAGWTELGQWKTTADDDYTTGVWRKVVTAASAEPASYRFTHSDNTSEPMAGYIVAVRGASTTTPEDAPVAHAAGINNSRPSSPSLTTTSPSALVLVHQALTRGALGSVVTPWDTTLLQSTKGTDRNGGLAAFLQATPGATGLRQWLNTGGFSGSEWHTVTVAVRPR